MIIPFSNKIVMVGFGSVGQAVLSLLIKHLALNPEQIAIITADTSGLEIINSYGISYKICSLDQNNYKDVLREHLQAGNLLLNLSVNVSSIALIELCQSAGVAYLDTCIEPWVGGYTDPNLTPSERSNYMLREKLLSLKQKYSKGATTVVTHGANPGLVSHFVKRALLNIANDLKMTIEVPQAKTGWAELARSLGIKAIHIAEKDTQETRHIKKHQEFVNTWSIDGFISEGSQPAELGWGSHEKNMPEEGAHHGVGSKAAIYLNRPGLSTRVRSWTPLAGSYHGFLVTHNESISLADYLTVKEGNSVLYRPTVHYSYHPCSDAILSIHEFLGNNFLQQPSQRILMNEIEQGLDELGVLLMGHKKSAYWYGSRLSIEEARKLASYNNATSLQVAAGVLGGLMWTLQNPNQGILEPEELDFEFVLKMAAPYLGTMIGEYSNWTPLQDRGQLFSEDLDYSDPWQFKNFLVA
jgi:homospermidine synthase